MGDFVEWLVGQGRPLWLVLLSIFTMACVFITVVVVVVYVCMSSWSLLPLLVFPIGGLAILAREYNRR